EPKIVAQRVELGFACVAGGVLALGRVWKLRSRTEHVAVRIYRARRQLKAWTAGLGAPVEPARRLFGIRHGTITSWAIRVSRRGPPRYANLRSARNPRSRVARTGVDQRARRPTVAARRCRLRSMARGPPLAW